MRTARLAPLLLLPFLLGCRGGGPGPAGPAAHDIEQVRASAPVVGRLVRAAMTCNLPMSVTGQDRAARIELAALEVLRREGGQPAYDAYLRSVQPPGFEPRQRGRDRAAWCSAERLEIERADGFLAGPEGAALAERAEAIRAAAATPR